MTGLPPSATPILSVHDSLVVECEADDAVRVARLIHEAVISAMGRFCSSVVAKVDVDIRRSLADEDVIAEYDPDAVPELLAAG
jgi:DNA polymerase I-like protein with 3'-5' exonuclease and polymerase domains